jgi:polygalacturonase
MPRFLQIWAAVLFLGGRAVAGAATYNIRDYGAKADKATNAGPAIQAAIDACNQTGGGDVLVPSGDYLTGQIALKSNVALVLQDGATLWASRRREDYAAGGGRMSFLITAQNQDNVAIEGAGAIQGLGQGDLYRRAGLEHQIYPPHRYGIMRFTGCHDVHVRDLRIVDSEAYTLILSHCERVFIDSVSILGNFFHTETDGIDPGSSKDVFISNCYIVTGDDCICPKTGRDGPLENLVVTNCILETSSTAIKLGTGSAADFRDIKVSNCVIRNSAVGIGLYIKDGGTAERLSFDNISIETTRPDVPINAPMRQGLFPIFVDIEQRAGAQAGGVRDISFSNIQITSADNSVIQGMTESPVRNVTLHNITVRVPTAFDFSAKRKHGGGPSNPRDDRITKYVQQPAYLVLANVDGLDVDDVRVLIEPEVFRQFDRSALAVLDSRDGIVRDVERRPATGPAGGQPAVAVSRCEDVRVISNP